MDHALPKQRSHKLARRRSMPSSTRMSRRRLRLLLSLFFLALTIPTAILVSHAYGQLKWEAFHQYRQLAEELSRRVDQRVARLLATEEARGFTDYQFLVVEGEGRANFLQRSALSTFPVKSDIPGLIGWFQIDTNGAFSTPLLPQLTIPADSYGLNKDNRKQRAALETRIQSILSANRLVGGRPPLAAATHNETLDEMRGKGLPAQVANAPLAATVDHALSAPKTLERDLKKDKEAEAVPSLRAAEVAAPAFSEKQRAAQENTNSARLNAKLQPAEQSAQAAFDQLSDAAEPAARRKQTLPGTLGRVDDLKLASPYASGEEEQNRQADAALSRQRVPKKRTTRKEVEISAYEPSSKNGDSATAFRANGGLGANADADASATTIASQSTSTSVRTDGRAEMRAEERTEERERDALSSSDGPRVLTFESELDPFEISILDSGHFVLYRKVWRDDQRFIQGALIEQKSFLSGLMEAAFEATALSRMSNLVVAWQGDVFAAFSGDAYRSRLTRSDELSGALLYRTRLSAPLASMELLFSVTQLPTGPGAKVILWTAAVLAMVLSIGVWLMYRLGVRQLALAQQQQDFVSAVSHELRTPITSIRMYAEMLREGWASEDKKRGYYEFIVQESERLSRLISNVLQLARMTHNDFAVQRQTMGVAQLMDGVRSKLTSQVQHAGFELRMQMSDAAMSAVLLVDPDAFSQCLINLVDNALKFAASASEKVIEVGCQLDSDGELSITVRDHGPGIAHDQMKLIFTLFYRSENELTRETVGTGIGLALVHQLMHAMRGNIDVANDKPGAIFTLRFPVHVGASAS